MKKKLFFLGSLLFFVGIVHSQEVHTVVFENGDTLHYTVYYDDPAMQPKWEVQLYFLGFMITDHGGFGLEVNPRIIFNPDLWVDAKYNSTIGLEEQIGSIGKNTFDFTPMVHYALLSHEKKKTTNFVLKTVSTGYQTYTNYTTKDFHYTKISNIEVDGGINIFRPRTKDYYGYTDSLGNDPYYTNNYQFISLVLGVSTHVFRNYKVTTPNHRYIGVGYHRFYAYFTQVFFGKYNCYYDNKVYSSVKDVSPLIEEPVLNKLGYRFGYEVAANILDLPIGIIMGVEMGVTPYYSFNKESNTGQSPSGILIFHFGMQFTQKVNH